MGKIDSQALKEKLLDNSFQSSSRPCNQAPKKIIRYGLSSYNKTCNRGLKTKFSNNLIS